MKEKAVISGHFCHLSGKTRTEKCPLELETEVLSGFGKTNTSSREASVWVPQKQPLK